MNVYKHHWSHEHKAAREDLWDVLHSTLDELPQRNYLYLCGDFNTNVTRSSDVFGQCYYISQQGPCRGTQTQDAERFHKLMEQSNLIALNSWNARMPPTFTAPWGCSRIDFIFTRRLAADLPSRNVAILDHMPLVPCSGPRHHPVLACVPRNWNFTPRLSLQNGHFQGGVKSMCVGSMTPRLGNT